MAIGNEATRDLVAGPVLTRRRAIQAGCGGVLAMTATPVRATSPAEGRGFGWRPSGAVGMMRRTPPRSPAFTVMEAGPSPVLLGFPWYRNFERPVERNGAWWIGLGRDWGEAIGGHIVCLRPPSLRDAPGAWEFYDQGDSHACAGFAASRAASLLRQRLFDGFRLYETAKHYDSWRGDGYDGTSVAGALEALVEEGPWPLRETADEPIRSAAIAGWRFAETLPEILAALESREGFVRVLNSWGNAYPREVRLPLKAVERLLAEGAEFGVAIDRFAA